MPRPGPPGVHSTGPSCHHYALKHRLGLAPGACAIHVAMWHQPLMSCLLVLRGCGWVVGGGSRHGLIGQHGQQARSVSPSATRAPATMAADTDRLCSMVLHGHVAGTSQSADRRPPPQPRRKVPPERSLFKDIDEAVSRTTHNLTMAHGMHKKVLVDCRIRGLIGWSGGVVLLSRGGGVLAAASGGAEGLPPRHRQPHRE